MILRKVNVILIFFHVMLFCKLFAVIYEGLVVSAGILQLLCVCSKLQKAQTCAHTYRIITTHMLAPNWFWTLTSYCWQEDESLVSFFSFIVKSTRTCFYEIKPNCLTLVTSAGVKRLPPLFPLALGKDLLKPNEEFNLCVCVGIFKIRIKCFQWRPFASYL